MVLGGVPVLALSIWKQDPGVTGHLKDLDLVDWACLFYVSVFGSAIAFGLFFYSATRGTLNVCLLLIFLVFLSIWRGNAPTVKNTVQVIRPCRNVQLCGE